MSTLNCNRVATLWRFNVFLTLIFAEHTALRSGEEVQTRGRFIAQRPFLFKIACEQHEHLLQNNLTALLGGVLGRCPRNSCCAREFKG